MTAASLSIIGLALNLAGVIVLFMFGMPFEIRTGGGRNVVTNPQPELLRAERIRGRLGWFGLGLLVLGTVLQIIGVAWT